MSTLLLPPSRLPQVGTTIFTTMSALAAKHGAVNLDQGVPESAFYPDGRSQQLARFCFAKTTETLSRALDKLAAL